MALLASKTRFTSSLVIDNVIDGTGFWVDLVAAIFLLLPSKMKNVSQRGCYVDLLRIDSNDSKIKSTAMESLSISLGTTKSWIARIKNR